VTSWEIERGRQKIKVQLQEYPELAASSTAFVARWPAIARRFSQYHSAWKARPQGWSAEIAAG